MIQIDRDKLRFFDGAYCGAEHNLRFVKAVWREDYRAKPLVAGGRAVTPILDMARWFDSGEKRSAGDFEALASVMVFRQMHSVAKGNFGFELEDQNLRDLFIPAPFGTAPAGSIIKGLRFRQFDGEVRQGKERERGIAFSDNGSLESYEATFEMLMAASLYGEPQTIVTGLPKFDPWFNELLVGLTEFTLPETQIREKLYRMKMVKKLQREYALNRAAVHALKLLCKRTPLAVTTDPEMYLRVLGQGSTNA